MNRKEFSAKHGALVFLLVFLLAQVVLVIWDFIITATAQLVGYSAPTRFVSTPVGYMLFSVGQFACFVVAYWFCYKKYNFHDNFPEKKFNIKWTALFLCFGLISMFALSYFVNFFSVFLNLVGKASSAIPYDINNWSSYILSIVSFAILPAIGEELLFRGTILNGLKSKGKLFAVVMSSIMFMIFHFSLEQMFYPFLFGLLLGIAYIYTDSLYVPMLMHFINNALNISLQYFAPRFIQPTSILFVVLGIVVYLVVLGISMILLYKKNKNESVVEILEAEKDKKSLLNKEVWSFWWPVLLMIALYIIIIFLGA